MSSTEPSAPDEAKETAPTDETVEAPAAAEDSAVEPEPEPEPVPLVIPSSFVIVAPAREIIEQLNLQVPVEHGGARQAAIACFQALNKQGGNNPTTLHLSVASDSISIALVQTPYVHG